MLYPIKFQPIFKDKIWGGQKIKTVLRKDFGNLPNCGETWELSGVEGDVSVVANGDLRGKNLTELIDQYGGTLLGDTVYKKFGNQFPLLIKFIDANADLSIQVHPDDNLAKERHNSFGKTEMWYTIQADPGSSLITGFNKEVSREEYLEKFESGHLMDILNRETVSNDDVFFLPAGRVHTIGKGLLIAEIQQTSDITYRIYDFDRVDDHGKKRELHVEEALDAIDYNFYAEYKTSYQDQKNTRNMLVTCPYFTTNKLTLNQPLECRWDSADSFRIYVCIEGKGNFRIGESDFPIKLGDVYLVPASLSSYNLEPVGDLILLESYIE